MPKRRLQFLIVAAVLSVLQSGPIGGVAQDKPILTLKDIPLVKGQLLIESIAEQKSRVRLGPAGQITVTASAFAVSVDRDNIKLISVGDAETLGQSGSQPMIGSVSISFSGSSAVLELFAKR